MYEKWLNLADPLHSKMIVSRVFIVKLASVRIKHARKLRDKHLQAWVQSRIGIYKEVKRLELLALKEAEQKLLRDLER